MSPDLVKGGKPIANANGKVKDVTHFLLTRKLGMGDVDHFYSIRNRQALAGKEPDENFPKGKNKYN